ncbi:MAG: hypothetical protein IJM51_01545 [Clostridia bacterium]|nr:hypothetical protein [Clostridia bacterium]
MKTDWKRKLSSRKFWAAVAGFVTPMLLAFGVTDSTATQVTALIMAGGSLIAYILGEGMIDAERRDMHHQ